RPPVRRPRRAAVRAPRRDRGAHRRRHRRDRAAPAGAAQMTAWLLDTLLYTGLLIALVLVLRGPVGRHFGPQTAYALWALPFLRLLLPPIVLPASLAPEPAEASAAAAEGWVAALPAEPVTFVAVAEPVALATPSEPGLLEGLGLAEIALGVWLEIGRAHV